MNQIAYIVISILCFVPAIILHECAHGFVASLLGDPTAKNSGRLTLNPIKHIDPFGTVVLPLILALSGMPVFGYAKPVPYNPRHFKNIRAGEVLVGLAGPTANLLLALAAALIAWILWPFANGLVMSNVVFAYFYLSFLPLFALVNLYLMFFNLIPVPPLDGASVIALFLPAKALPAYYRVQQYALPGLMILLIGLPYFLHVNPIGIYLNFTAVGLANLLFPFAVA